CQGRITIEGGSFFERVPDGCDAYIMKHIIHDWSDEHCRMILKLMGDKLPTDGRVLVCEMVVTDEPGPTPAKMLDIEMLVLAVGGKERTKDEFAELFASSGSLSSAWMRATSGGIRSAVSNTPTPERKASAHPSELTSKPR